MRSYSIFLFVLFIGFSQPTCAQTAFDSTAVRDLNSKAYRLYLSRPDSAILLATEALAKAEKANSKNQKGYSFFILSKAHWAKTNYLLSIEFAFKALAIFENTSEVFLLGESYVSLARTFADLQNYNQSRIYINKAEALAKKSGNNAVLASMFREKSFLLLQLEQYDSALYCSNEGIKLYEASKDTLEASILYGRNTRTYFALKNFPKSIEFSRKSIRMDSLVRNLRGLGVSYFQGAQILNALGKPDSALLYLKKSLALSTRIRNLPTIIRTHETMADIYLKKNKPDLSIANLKLALQYKDSLYNQERDGQILEMRALYDLERQDKTIQLLEKENAIEKHKASNQQLLMIFFVVVILLLSVLLYIFWRLRQTQTKTNRELAEKNQNIALQNEEIQSQAESLHKINQLKSKILSVISHDLRGPVNNLHALLELVTRERMTPDEFVQTSFKLKSNLSVTQRALENLLNWSLGQMEGIKTEPVVFNINSIVEDVAVLSEEQANRKQIIVKTDSKEPMFVEADVNQVHLILRNLFNNAIKFSKRDGEVTMLAEKKGKFCYIHIEDNGIGMTKAEVEMIINSNEYFTKSGTDQEKGTGLGLLLCKDFIKRNRGEYFIESKPGQGTRITFTLPLA